MDVFGSVALHQLSRGPAATMVPLAAADTMLMLAELTPD
jgi:hypothetical protein